MKFYLSKNIPVEFHRQTGLLLTVEVSNAKYQLIKNGK